MANGSNLSAGRRSVGAMLAVGLLVGMLPSGAVGAAEGEQDDRRLVAFEVETRSARDVGLTRPVGVAYDSRRDEFVVAAESSSGAIVARVDRDWERVGGAALPGVDNPSTLIYDTATDSFRSVEGDRLISVKGSNLSARTESDEVPLEGSGLADPSSATYDDSTGTMLVTDSGTVAAVDDDGSLEDSMRVDGMEDGDLIARHPVDGNLYVLDADDDRLVALDAEGHVEATYDVSTELVSPEAMTFAPSTDSTDDPESQNLFIADSGDATSEGGVTEVVLKNTAEFSAQAVETASLVNVVDTSLWSPPSTDPSGVAWNLSRQQLIVVDSEVEEDEDTGEWANVNMWHTNTLGSVAQVGATFGPLSAGSYSDEPTGADYDNATGTLFVSDDTGTRSVFVVRPGGDGELGTTDDQVNPIAVGSLGASDAEEPAYDANSGDLFFLSGTDQEMFRLDPGPDAQFGTTDDTSSHFDLGFLPSGDFEGLTVSQARDTLFVGSRATDQIWEITKDGSTVIREIQVDVGQSFISGLTLAPSSDDPSQFSLYFVDRGVDAANDGELYEIRVPNLDEPVGNLAPTVDAGADQTITYPASASLQGTVVDDGLPDGSVLTSTWSKVSGPGTVTFADPSAPATTATFSMPGVYELRLQATDSALSNSDIVVVTVDAPPVNTAPTVNAGPDQVIASGTVANLSGVVGDDGLPPPPTGNLTSTWSKLTGPGNVTFGSASLPATTATFTLPGVYELRLQASDGELTASDTVVITVNVAPTVDAGPDQTVPSDGTANLNGVVTDDGLPASGTLTSTWSKVSGPGTVTFGNSSLPATTASFSQAGVYELRLQANDGAASASDTVVITANSAPAVDAGADQAVTFPGPVNLRGSVDDDGFPGGPVTSTWSKLTGPGTVTFADASLPTTTATFSQPGLYELRLQANDGAATGSDTVVVSVNSGPSVDAGPDQIVTFPGPAFLEGSVEDDGVSGETLTFTWSKVSGPGAVDFDDPSVPETTATFSQSGVYQLRLQASDGGLFGSDTLTVTVNTPPTADAGEDQTIPWEAAAELNGTVDDDGLPGGELTSTWSIVSGPGDVDFDDATSPSTSATFTEPGTYELELKVSDGALSVGDTTSVTVEGPPVEPPTDPEVKPGTDWFTDDETSVFEDDINAVAGAGISRGCNPPFNDRFCPEGTVTRGQMAAFLVRALNLTDDGGGDLFRDDDGHIFESDIDRLAAADVTRGCNPPANDRFCPDDPLTRAQMAAFLVRALGYDDDGGGDLFRDDDGHVFEGDIDRLGTAGVTRGCNPPGNDRFCPDDPLTRGQMAAFLARAFLYNP